VPVQACNGTSLLYFTHQLEIFLEKRKILPYFESNPGCSNLQPTQATAPLLNMENGKTHQYLKKLDRAVTSGSASPLPSMLFASCSNNAGSMLISVMYADTNTLILTCGGRISEHATLHTHCALCTGIATTEDLVDRRGATPQCEVDVPILCFVIYLWHHIAISAPSIDTKR